MIQSKLLHPNVPVAFSGTVLVYQMDHVGDKDTIVRNATAQCRSLKLFLTVCVG